MSGNPSERFVLDPFFGGGTWTPSNVVIERSKKISSVEALFDVSIKEGGRVERSRPGWTSSRSSNVERNIEKGRLRHGGSIGRHT